MIDRVETNDNWAAVQREWENPSNWHGGILGIYYAPGDHRTIVRKRWYPGGWTFNFARRASWFCLGGILFAAVVMSWVVSR